MGKAISKPLFDLKISGFTGIQENVNPFASPNSVLRSTNLIAYDKPGILKTRDPYYLKYETPVDSLARLSNQKFISFDNFYEAQSSSGVEVTIEVQTAVISAPNNVAGVVYQFNAPVVWMRPFFNGTYWEDKWGWINECIITNLASATDATYKNQFDIQGKFGNINQYSIINITRDPSSPSAILESFEGAVNTTIFMSNFSNNWQNGDVVVLMKNYIPLKYLLEMYNVTAQEISFHRLPSKMRIGFGGKNGRIGLGIEFINGTVQIADYSLQAVAPRLVGQELLFAAAKRMIIQPYALFNEDSKDFGLNILTAAGDFPAGTYYFRLTGMLNATDEFLLLETSIESIANQKFFPIPWFRSGSMSRRLTSFNVYFGQDNGTGQIDYYFFRNYEVRLDGNKISEKYWTLGNDGNFVYVQPANITTNLYTEVSAAGPGNEDAVGSWTYQDTVNDPAKMTILVTGSSPYYVTLSQSNLFPLDQIQMVLPVSALTAKLNSLARYNIQFTCRSLLGASTPTQLIVSVTLRSLSDSTITSETKVINTSGLDETYNFGLYCPDFSKLPVSDLVFLFTVQGKTQIFSGEHLDIRAFEVLEQQSNYLNSDTLLGGLDETLMGYPPVMSYVKDWGCAVVRGGSAFLGACFVDKRYATLIFFSPVSGDGTSQYDVLPDNSFLDSDKDFFRGETVIALAQIKNTWLLSLTEAGGTIINPDTNDTQEIARGHGILAKDSLSDFKGIKFWASTDDIVATDQSGINADIIDEDSVRGIYNGIPDKTKVTGCIDKFGSYHMSLGIYAAVQELVFNKRGWFDQSRDDYPQILRNCFLGVMWFMDPKGNIYSGPSVLPEDVGYADVYGDFRSGW